MKVFIGLLGLMTMLQAQPGATMHSSTFDPAILPRGPVIENRLQTPPRRSTITPAQEAQHRAFVPAKGPVGVPQLETPDGRRAPVQILQPLQTAPSVSVQGLQQDLLPPSPNAAAGPDDVIQVINSKVARFTKFGVVTDI